MSPAPDATEPMGREATSQPPTRQPIRTPKIPSRVVTTALVLLIVVFLLARIDGPVGLLLGFLLLTPIERIWKRHDQPVRRPGLRTDMFHLLLTGGLASAFVTIPVVFWYVVLTPFRNNAVATAFNVQPGWLRAVEGFLLVQLFVYWVHRLEHEIPVLWRFHAVHHSSKRLDWIAAARIHPVEGLIAGSIAAAPLLLIGFGPATLGAFVIFAPLWGLMLHMNVRWRMRWLDGIWASPDYHHWHHANHPVAMNSNYSGTLPVLDILFGSYYMPKDRRPTVYGIDEPMPDGWWQHMLQPFRRAAPVERSVPEQSPLGQTAGGPATVGTSRADRDDLVRRPTAR